MHNSTVQECFLIVECTQALCRSAEVQKCNFPFKKPLGVLWLLLNREIKKIFLKRIVSLIQFLTLNISLVKNANTKAFIDVLVVAKKRPSLEAKQSLLKIIINIAVLKEILDGSYLSMHSESHKMSLLIISLIPISSIISAAILAYHGIAGWGWFLFIAVLSGGFGAIQNAASNSKK